MQERYDADLEVLLSEIFQMPKKKASEGAKILTLYEFETNYRRLEDIIGYGAARDVVQNGDFTYYRNNQLEDYLQLARQAHIKLEDAKRLKTHIPIPHNLFYSIQSVRKFLGLSNGESKVDSTKLDSLDISRYLILHRDNEKSAKYLDSLIRHGYVNILHHEHWVKAPKHKGSRGRHILKKIAFELVCIFHDLGLSRPKYKINYGQDQLMVYGNTIQFLRQIRDKVYASQN